MNGPNIEELRQAMSWYTARLDPPQDLASTVRQRVARRRAVGAIAALVAVGAVGGVAASIVARSNHGESNGRIAAAAIPPPFTTPVTAASVLDTASAPVTSRAAEASTGIASADPPVPPPTEAYASGAPNMVDWASWSYRGDLAVEGPDTIDVQAGAAWGAKHQIPTNQLFAVPLLGVSVNSTTSVFMFEITKLMASEGNLVVYVKDGAGARIVYDAPAALSTEGLSVRIAIGTANYVLAIAAPGLSVRSLHDSGRTEAIPVASLPAALRGADWAVFPVTSRRPQAESIAVARCNGARCGSTSEVPVG